MLSNSYPKHQIAQYIAQYVLGPHHRHKGPQEYRQSFKPLHNDPSLPHYSQFHESGESISPLQYPFVVSPRVVGHYDCRPCNFMGSLGGPFLKSQTWFPFAARMHAALGTLGTVPTITCNCALQSHSTIVATLDDLPLVA